MEILKHSGIILIACLCIMYFTDLLSTTLETIGKKARIPISVRGAALDGPSSSIPELLASIVAAIMFIGAFGQTADPTAFSEVGIGTIGGSAIFNILIIPFASLCVVSNEQLSTIKIDKKAMFRDLGIYIIALGLLWYSAHIGKLTIAMSGSMLGLYIAYTYKLLKEDRTVEEVPEEIKNKKYLPLILKALLVLIPVGIAVHYAVISAGIIATTLNVPRIITSLIILASATSIPDTILSIVSAKRGELDASIANAVGSNIFDILICLGGVLFMIQTEIPLELGTTAYIFKFLLASAFFYTIAFTTNTNKIQKLSLLAIPYIAFIIYLATNIA